VRDGPTLTFVAIAEVSTIRVSGWVKCESKVPGDPSAHADGTESSLLSRVSGDNARKLSTAFDNTSTT
jgi:hypothetical protein